jgi:DNA-binding GntR family transcriptional regulator
MAGILPESGVAARPERNTAAGRIYSALRERILNLDLPPNTTLSRAEIAHDYEVSQTPVREALLQLEQDGLIKTYPQSRTVVTEIDPDQLSEAHFLRIAVETEISRSLCLRSDPAITGKARAILQMQETLASNTTQISLFYALDSAFHEALFLAAGQPNLHALLESITGHLTRARRLDLPSVGKLRDILQGHRAILDSIESGVEAQATAAIRGHLQETLLRLDRLMAENPGYFKKSKRVSAG